MSNLTLAQHYSRHFSTSQAEQRATGSSESHEYFKKLPYDDGIILALCCVFGYLGCCRNQSALREAAIKSKVLFEFHKTGMFNRKCEKQNSKRNEQKYPENTCLLCVNNHMLMSPSSHCILTPAFSPSHTYSLPPSTQISLTVICCCM